MTPKQHMAELQAWLDERGIDIVLIAVGRRTGQPADIRDWETETHRFDYAIVLRGNNEPNDSSGS